MKPGFSNSCHHFPKIILILIFKFLANFTVIRLFTAVLMQSDVAPEDNTNQNVFTATHFGTGLVAKKMVFLVLKDN